MAPLQLWLFDEPPVTLAEIAEWTQEHARITPDNWRYSYYVKGWDVAGKIRAQKANALRTRTSLVAKAHRKLKQKVNLIKKEDT